MYPAAQENQTGTATKGNISTETGTETTGKEIKHVFNGESPALSFFMHSLDCSKVEST